jgi:hypothetical protein
LLLLIIGAVFLWRNLQPDFPMFDLIARYWPFVLIAWGVLRLVEVIIWRPDPVRGSFTGGEIALIVLITLVGSGLFQAHRHGIRLGGHGFDMFGDNYDFPISARAPVAGATRVVFENPRGNIRIVGAESQEIVISGRKLIRAVGRREAEQANTNTPVEIVAQGDRILVRTNQDRLPNRQRISHDLEVKLPRKLDIEARGSSGDYDVTGITGNVELAGGRADVRLNRIGGNARIQLERSDLVRAVDVNGNLDLQGRGSDVEIENVAGQVTISGSYGGTLDFKNLAKPLRFDSRNTELRVAALPGRISMDLGEFSAKNLVGPVRLVTRSRDIIIEDFTHSLELETERGDIELQPARVPLPKIEAKSRTGRIELVLPEKAAFELQATAEQGDAVNDFGPGIKKEVDGRTATLKGKVGNGPAILLTTSRGTVSVRRSGLAPPAPPSPPKPPRSLAETEVTL